MAVQKLMPILGQIGSFWGKNSYFFTGEIKSFAIHITENPPGHLVHISFWTVIGQNVQKWQYLAQNDQKCIFCTKFGRFWAKNPNFMGVSKSFGTNITENHLDNLFASFFG